MQKKIKGNEKRKKDKVILFIIDKNRFKLVTIVAGGELYDILSQRKETCLQQHLLSYCLLKNLIPYL